MLPPENKPYMLTLAKSFEGSRSKDSICIVLWNLSCVISLSTPHLGITPFRRLHCCGTINVH